MDEANALTPAQAPFSGGLEALQHMLAQGSKGTGLCGAVSLPECYVPCPLALLEQKNLSRFPGGSLWSAQNRDPTR